MVAPASEGLHGPRDDEELEVGRHRGGERAYGEDEERGPEEQRVAVDVGEACCQRNGGGEAEEVGRDDPRGAVELGGGHLEVGHDLR